VILGMATGNEKMRSWLKEARFGGSGRRADDELAP